MRYMEMADLGFRFRSGAVFAIQEWTLAPIDGNLNTEKYMSLLDSHLWQVIAEHFVNAPRIFQDDNCPCHMSERSKEWKNQNDTP